MKYESVYPGIDLIYYGNHHQLEFDFVVAPGANPRSIKLDMQSKGLRIAKDGALLIADSDAPMQLHAPNSYQMIGSRRVSIPSRFVAEAGKQVSFEVANYNHQYPLIIDPSFGYSTYLGGNVYDLSIGLAVDSAGNTYLAGQTFSTTFPTADGYSTVGNENGKGYVAKLDPTGTTLLYSTYVGGSGSDNAAGIAIDGTGGVYTTGFTTSTDFPVVNGFQAALGGPYGNAFVMRLDTTQSGAASLVYSSFIGGGGNSTSSAGDTGFAIATDGNGLAYVTGQATLSCPQSPRRGSYDALLRF